MDFKEQFRYMDRISIDERDSLPEWVRAEHMERSVPLKELWKYPGVLETKTGIMEHFTRWWKRRRVSKKKYEIRCSSSEEMDRIADAMIGKGFYVERVTGILPAQSYGLYLPVYKVIYWEDGGH